MVGLRGRLLFTRIGDYASSNPYRVRGAGCLLETFASRGAARTHNLSCGLL